jgi:demethylmenaquinone methyltransferase/2-methoxy-6-polyprenyl-1,4-benzoquinol methylase
MFAEIAGRYDFLNHLLSFSMDRYWRWRTIRKVPPRSGLPILDICTGTGDLALGYQRRAAGKATVVASDFCHEMLVVGTRKEKPCGQPIGWVEADSQRLPFRDGQFQIVSVAFGLRNVTDTDRGLAEMARVCTPGGTVAILEFSLPRRQPFAAIYRAYFRHLLPRIGQLLARNREAAYNYLPQSVGEFPQGVQLAERLRAAGLASVRWYPMTLGVVTLYLAKRAAE